MWLITVFDLIRSLGCAFIMNNVADVPKDFLQWEVRDLAAICCRSGWGVSSGGSLAARCRGCDAGWSTHHSDGSWMTSPAPAMSSPGGPSATTGGGQGLAARCCSGGIG